MISAWMWLLATLAGVLVAAGISAAVKASPSWRQTAAPTNGAVSAVTRTQSPSGSRANPPRWGGACWRHRALGFWAEPGDDEAAISPSTNTRCHILNWLF